MNEYETTAYMLTPETKQKVEDLLKLSDNQFAVYAVLFHKLKELNERIGELEKK